MDARPPPPVTIESGSGRSQDGRPDLLGAEDEPLRDERSWLDRHRLGGLALAAIAGFALATGLADLRTTTLEESAEGALSLEVHLESRIRPHIAATADGRRALATSVSIRNTGPHPVAFERAELLGTPYRSDDLRGRRVASGAESVVVLLRSIDCSRLDSTPVPGPLRVHATTGAGIRSVDLRMSADLLQFQDDQVRAACGRNDPDEALFVQDGRDSVDGASLVIDLALRNASARPLSVERLVIAPGLRVADVTSRGRAPVTLPLRLEPGDFDPPVDPVFGSGPEVELSVRLEIADCGLFRPSSPDDTGPSVLVWVTGGRHGHAFGNDPVLLHRWRNAACGAD